MRKTKLRFGVKGLLTLLAGILLGALLMTLVYLIPINEENYDKTKFSIAQEGWYPNVPIVTNTYNTYFQTWLPGVLDNNTVRTFMIPIAYAQTDQPLYEAMNCQGYSYYWHGYAILLRPLQYFFDLEEMQLANSFCQMTLIVFLAIVIAKKQGSRYVLMLISGYALMMPMAVSVCLQYSAVFYIAYGGCLFLVCKRDWLKENHRHYLFFMVLGMLTSYFDLLTYPLLTWGIPIIWWVITEKGQESVLTSLKKTVLQGITWIVGYGFMWFGKWVLATLLLRKNVVAAAFDEILFRTGGVNETVFGLKNQLYSIYMNWKHYNYKLYVILLLAWFVFWLIYGFFRGWKRPDTAKSCAYLLIGSSSFVWYLVLLNHTEIHHSFTYRIFGITISAFFALVLESVGEKKVNLKYRICFCLKNVMAVILAVLCTFVTKELTEISNKECPCFDAEIARTESLEVSFTPAYDRIFAIALGMRFETEQGKFLLSLYDDGERLYGKEVEIGSLGGEYYKYLAVDWRLSPGKEYLITVELVDTEGDISLFRTQDEQLPLEGCFYRDGGVKTASQPLIGFYYWCRPIVLQTKVLLGLSYWGLFLAIFYVADGLFAEIRSGRDRGHS